MNKELALDVSADEARALHRIVRSMHDGHCPKCGHLNCADAFVKYSAMHQVGHSCPDCGFFVSSDEAAQALKMFQPYLQKSVAIFEEWRDRKLVKNEY